MKIFTLLLITAMMCSCTSTKKIMNSWIGSPATRLVQSWGPPQRKVSDENGGLIYIYGRRSAGRILETNYDYWEYKMMYVNSEGIIYHWLTQKQNNPPDRVDVNLYIR